MSLTPGAKQMIGLGAQGSYSVSRDAIKHQIWDMRTFGTSRSDFTFFSQPQGAQWKTTFSKTLNETNLNDSGKLPNGQTFVITRMGVGLTSVLQAANTAGATYVQAFINILQSSVFNIVVAGRDFDFQVHGRQFIAPIAMSSSTAGTINAQRHGDQVTSGWVKLDPSPIFLDQLVSFKVQQFFNNPDTNIQTVLDANCTLLNAIYATMTVTLEGFLTRAK
jgi:hypothetical protein